MKNLEQKLDNAIGAYKMAAIVIEAVTHLPEAQQESALFEGSYRSSPFTLFSEPYDSCNYATSIAPEGALKELRDNVRNTLWNRADNEGTRKAYLVDQEAEFASVRTAYETMRETICEVAGVDPQELKSWYESSPAMKMQLHQPDVVGPYIDNVVHDLEKLRPYIQRISK